MIDRIIGFSIRNKLLIGIMTLALIGAGIWSMLRVPIDAVPDITNNQVQVITQAPNLGTEDIEQFVTYPVEVALSNLPGVIEIRSVSRFGLSVVTVVFEDDMGIYRPRQLVQEKLSQVQEEIPEGFGKPHMGPISTGLGEIYQYTLEVDSAHQGEYSITDLRSIQDWIVRRQMAMVPGVVEVNAFGGKVKQYEVAIDPDELRAIDLTMADLMEALKRNNQNTGGAYIEKNHRANFIRGEGLARSLDDLRNIVVANQNGIPVKVGDIAKVRFGSAVRYGTFTKDGKGEAVGGMILMLKGANSNKVISAVKERMEQIQKSLPEGVRIEPFLDRSELIADTTGTISNNLIEGALIVIFVLVFLLGNWRGGLIVASTIPLSLLFAFILMYTFDVWANLMSLGAIDFGIIVDGAVIIVEGTVFMLVSQFKKGQKTTRESRDKLTYRASSKMMNSAFFGQLIILIVFLPILFLEGIEGKMFQPMALTFMFAMLGAMVLCLTYVPMMSALTLKPSNSEKRTWGDKLVFWLENRYERLLEKALRKTTTIVLSALALLAVAIFLFTRLGGEFIPQLDEGDLAFHIILKPGSSLSESIETSSKIEGILLEEFPEVEHAMTRFGVADVPTDPMPMDLGDCIVILKPKSEWQSAETKPELISKMKERLSVIPGVNYEFTQPIEMRFNELLTGVREDVAVKLYGEDLQLLAEKAEEIGDIVATVDGVGDMRVEATTGLPQMTVHYQRDKLAQYGLNVKEINTVIETAFAGGHAGVIFEGERRYDLVVRLDSAHRQGIDNLKNLYVSTPEGAQIPLKEVANVSYEPGPMQISRDNTNRRVYVGINVRGRDVESLVEEIQARLDEELQLPPGYYIRYGGDFENLQRATARLSVVVPIALALIFILILLALRSIKQSLMIYLAIPMAAIGGVFSLWLRGMPFSISAGIGFIVLFGVAVLNGLVLINGWNELKSEGADNLRERIRQGARRRLRPIMLTALTDIFGFLPMAISTSAGAEVQRPLATVVIGGLITSTLLTLFILPILYKWIERPKLSGKMARAIASVTIPILAGLFIPKAVTAQNADSIPTISMEEAIGKALENYPDLRASKLLVEKEKALRKTAWDLGTTQVITAGEEIGGEDIGVITTVGVQQQNMDVFGISPKIRENKRKTELAESSLELTRARLTRHVKQAYSQTYILRRKLEFYSRLDSIYKEFRRATEVRYEVEAISKLAYLAAQNQVKEVTIERSQAEFDYRKALSQLNRWLASDTVFTVDTNAQFTSPLAIADTLGNHPLLEVAGNRVELADASRRAAKSNLLPKLNAQYGQQRVNGEDGFYQYQFGLNIPLFFMKDQGRIQAARIEQEIAAEELRQTRYEIESEYERLVQEYRKWRSSWRFYQQENLPLAREQQRGALIAFKEGAIDYTDFIQNFEKAVQIEINSLNALKNYLLAKNDLEYYLNHNTKTNN